MGKLFIVQVLDNCANTPEKSALIRAEDGLKISYAQLGRKIAGTTLRLRDMGLKKGDAVILAASRSFDFIFMYLALHSQGMIAIPLDPRTPLSRFESIRRECKPSLQIWPEAKMPGSIDYEECVCEGDNEIEVKARSEDLADIMFTSGTTGKPKGVELSHANIAAAVSNINQYIGNNSDDIEVCPMPLSHSFGIARIRCNLAAGATLVLEDGITRPKHLFESLEKYKATGLGMVGPAWMMLHKMSGDRIARFDRQLRYFELGSAPLKASDKNSLAKLLPDTRVCMHYGLTEASRAAFLDFHADSDRLESVGKAAPLFEIAIFSEAGVKLDSGETGEVCVAGDVVFNRYLDEKHNAEAFHKGKFFRTGDLGWLDAEGYLHLVGRSKEMINVGGEKLSPYEVEGELEACPGIAEAACIGLPDPVLGESVLAFVVPEENCAPDLEAILSALKTRLETFKIPKEIRIIAELPRTVSGKIKRASLKEQFDGAC